MMLSCLRSFHTAGLSKPTIVSINAWPGKMCMFCLFRPTSLTKQCWHHLYTSDAFGSWGTSLCHVGWCSVKTNKQEKKKKGEKKNKKTKTIPSSVWLFIKRKNTELHIHQHRENGCTVDHSLFFFKLFIFPNEICWKEVAFLEIHSSSIKSWKLRLPKICVLTCQPHLCAYVHTYAFVCTFLSQVQQGLVCFFL